LTKYFLIAIFLILSIKIYAQQETDGKFLFKTWFFIEHVNVISRTEKTINCKDSVLFNLYNNYLDLKLDTLKSSGFSANYIFLSVVSYKNNKIVNDSAIQYKRSGYLSYLSIPVNNCEGYVLCVNKTNGKSYRIKGFSGNDFLCLLTEIKEQYFLHNNKPLSNRFFFKNYTTEGIDFNCIYNALVSGSYDNKLFPCLKHCSPLIIKA